MGESGGRSEPVSVVIPARNEEGLIGGVVRAVLAQDAPPGGIEVIVADDGSRDGTAAAASKAGAIVLTVNEIGRPGNPGAARNRGAAEASGDPIVFLDADCLPRPGWLAALLGSLAECGADAVGGAVARPAGGGLFDRASYYGGCYHMHPGRRAGAVTNHTPCNLAVRRESFLSTRRFAESHPVADGHEELGWQGEIVARGGTIFLQPKAVVVHHDRPRFRDLLERNYRWGYSAVEAKAESGAARGAFAYRHPRLLAAAGIPLALPATVYVIGCWLRAGIVEPLLLAPLLFAGRLAYGIGFTGGAFRWLRRRKRGLAGRRARAS